MFIASHFNNNCAPLERHVHCGIQLHAAPNGAE